MFRSSAPDWGTWIAPSHEIILPIGPVSDVQEVISPNALMSQSYLLWPYAAAPQQSMTTDTIEATRQTTETNRSILRLTNKPSCVFKTHVPASGRRETIFPAPAGYDIP